VKRIAIIGSPNCGKTTLFNRLTGARQRTGNWPGVTVERKQGRFSTNTTDVELIDLPGIYSLEGEHAGIDAKVARDYLASNEADLILLVIDATQMARQLRLLPQLQKMGLPLLIAVNMMDSAERENIDINLSSLAEFTGNVCVGMSASKGDGMDRLMTNMDRLLTEPGQTPSPTHLRIENIQHIAQKICTYQAQATGLTDRIDRWVLHSWLALPTFLLVMYLLFSISVNLGAVFIDFFDIWLGSWLVDGSRWLFTALGSPEWLTTLISDGLGGGVQLVCTFIPVIGFLYLCMSVLEDSGYLSRAAFVIDGMMSRIGLPGQAFIPLIVGFGCNVPSVMAARALDRPSTRLTTIFIAPFMSCGARLSVYVFIGTAMFPDRAGGAIFLLYMLGIIVAIGSAWLLRKSLFRAENDGQIAEMPAYHKPLLRNVLTQTWQRLSAFMMRAGKRILAVVLVLSVVSSIGTDGSWGNKDNDKSLLASIGKSVTPLLVPIGIGADNWPATVGLFTGLFAKEVVVGTLDTLYNPPAKDAPGNAMPDFGAGMNDALQSIADNGQALGESLLNPLGINIGSLSNAEQAASDQGVNTKSYSSMVALFPSAWAAFCYLVFILLYAPCVATIGVMQKEAGSAWLQFSVIWSLLLSYWLASNLWQMSRVFEQPIMALGWLGCSSLVLYGCYQLIVQRVRRQYAHEIPVIQL
jgi:ferrous iron transport protein B